MIVTLPDLRDRWIYSIEEISALHLNDEVKYSVVAAHYSTHYGADYFGERDHEIVVEYRTIDLKVLEPQVKELVSLFRDHNDHLARVETIKELLIRGSVAWPLLIQRKQNVFTFSECEIHEGNHRAVAHYQLGSERIPVLIMRYAFEPF